MTKILSVLSLILIFFILTFLFSINLPDSKNTEVLSAYTNNQNTYKGKFAVHSFINITYPYKTKEYLFGAAKRTGKNTMRISFHMNEIWPTENKPKDWSKLDENYNLALKNGFTNILFEFNSTAPWIADSKAENKYFGPINEDKYFLYTKFIDETVKRYPKVLYWEVWNEPEISGYKNYPDKYASLIKNVYPVIKNANPNSQVLMGGLASLPHSATWFGTALKTPYGDKSNMLNYFDIANFHIRGNLDYVVTKSIQNVKFFKSIGKSRIWITEMGYPSDFKFQKDPKYRSGEGSQANYYRKVLPELNKLEVEKIFITLKDIGFYEKPCNTTGSSFCSEGLVTLINSTSSGRDKESLKVFQQF